jgi:signal transduction histidine kinase
MQAISGDIQILIIATVFILLVTLAPILFVLMHQRQYHRYLSRTEEIRNAYQRELLQSQLEIQNQTLQQVSQDLHDNIGQLLTVTLMRLNTLEEETAGTEAQLSVYQTRDLVKTIIGDVRMLGKTLDYDTVRRFGLLDSLALELERIQRVARIKTQLDVQGEIYSLVEKAEIVLLRMAQEGLNNALKHARAKTLSVQIEYKTDSVILTIADDGKGFDVQEANNRKLSLNAGAGLSNLRRRAELLGGQFLITSQIGSGSRIEINLPRRQPDHL